MLHQQRHTAPKFLHHVVYFLGSELQCCRHTIDILHCAAYGWVAHDVVDARGDAVNLQHYTVQRGHHVVHLLHHAMLFKAFYYLSWLQTLCCCLAHDKAYLEVAHEVGVNLGLRSNGDAKLWVDVAQYGDVFAHVLVVEQDFPDRADFVSVGIDRC